MANDKKEKVGTIDYQNLPPLDSDVDNVMKTEFGIAFWLSLAYFVFLVAVPVLNWKAPAFMATRVWGGMSLTWFLTGIVSMVLAYLVAWAHLHLYQKKFGIGAEPDTPQSDKGVWH